MSSLSDQGVDAPARIKQRRSRVTFEALIEAGFRLLEERDLDSISVAQIAEEAGYSVGAFYARFSGKEEFHATLVERYTTERHKNIAALFSTTSDEDILPTYFDSMVERIWRNRFFWRASIIRSMPDPSFWEPFRQGSNEMGLKLARSAERHAGRPLDAEEVMRIRFALQLVNGLINSAIMNRPGPVMIEDQDLPRRLEQAFRDVSHWDSLRGGDA